MEVLECKYSTLLQVSMAEGASAAQGVSLQGSWVDLLSIRVPVLAVAVDDPLLACADRLMQHWSTPGAHVLKSLAIGPCQCEDMCPLPAHSIKEAGDCIS